VGSAGFTVTVTVDVAVPPAPVAVAVYTVVTIGATPTDPEVATGPTPLMETPVESVLDHVSMADCPAVIVAGAADKNTVGVGTGGGVPPLSVMYSDQWHAQVLGLVENVAGSAPNEYP